MSHPKGWEKIVKALLGELQLDYEIFSVFQPPSMDNRWCIQLTPPGDRTFEIKFNWDGGLAANAKEEIKSQLQ